MGQVMAQVRLRALPASEGSYDADFVVDTGATDSMAPASELKKIGVVTAGTQNYRLADAQLHEMEFGYVWLEVESQLVPGIVVFGPENEKPLLGVTALEAAGLAVDPVNRKLVKVESKPLL